MRLDPRQLRQLLSAGSAVTPPEPEGTRRRAAVAIILQPDGVDSRLLLIRRAEREGDPWSGHMALPGGHWEPQDSDSQATAMRETLEEVGLPLRRQDCLGTMASLQATAKGRPTGTLITPHVFSVAEPKPLQPNAEVAATFWAPIGPMALGKWDTVKRLEYGGQRLSMPAIDVHGNLVWGLTLRMIKELFSVVMAAPGPADVLASEP